MKTDSTETGWDLKALVLILIVVITASHSPAFAETEPNNEPIDANQISVDGTETSGQLYANEDVDFYRISTLASGALTISLRPENSHYDGGSVSAELLDSELRVLASLPVKSDSQKVTLRSSTSAGVYYLKISKRDSYKIFDKDYVFSAILDTSSHLEQEPNNERSSANQLPNPDTQDEIFGIISSTEDKDWFYLDIGRESVFSIQVAPENEAYDGGAILVEVIDSNGVMLSARKLGSDSSPIELRARTGAGRVYVRVGQYDGIKLMSKEYLIVPSVVSDMNSVALRESEPNDDYPQANRRFSDTRFSGQLSSKFDRDVFEIRPGVNAVVRYEITPENMQYDGGAVGVSVLDSDGQVLVTRPVGSDYATDISFVSEVGKSYFLVFERYYDYYAYFGPGFLKTFDKDYEVEAHFSTDYEYENEPNADCSAASDVTKSSLLFGLVHVPDDVDCYPVRLLATGTVQFNVGPVFSAYDGGVLRATLKDADGNILAAKDVKSDAADLTTLQGSASRNGWYFLVVSRKEGARLIDDREYQIEVLADSDGDGLINVEDADNDNDGLPDALESFLGLDYLNPMDAREDLDGDGFTNVEEYRSGTDLFDPLSNRGSNARKAKPAIDFLLLGPQDRR